MVGRITVIATAMAVGTEAADLQPAEEALLDSEDRDAEDLGARLVHREVPTHGAEEVGGLLGFESRDSCLGGFPFGADQAEAGEIVAVAGLDQFSIGDTIADFEDPVALPRVTIDEPTVQMTFSPFRSPRC